jgi:hypothetical protein
LDPRWDLMERYSFTRRYRSVSFGALKPVENFFPERSEQTRMETSFFISKVARMVLPMFWPSLPVIVIRPVASASYLVPYPSAAVPSSFSLSQAQSKPRVTKSRYTGFAIVAFSCPNVVTKTRAFPYVFSQMTV